MPAVDHAVVGLQSSRHVWLATEPLTFRALTEVNVTLPVLIISGTIGAGKSTVGLATQEILEEFQQPHAFLDLDRLTDFYPKQGPFNTEGMFKALSSIWPVYTSFGADRLILARVVEDRAELDQYAAALGDCSFTVVLVRASESTRQVRIAAREFGESLKWHARRSTELDHILNEAKAHDFEVFNDGRDPRETAMEILDRTGWINTKKDAV